jgi:predicted ATPase
MKLESISIEGQPPIEKFTADNLSNIVVIAGPNGVGKTRLIASILETLRQPGSHPGRRLLVRATSEGERLAWGQDTLDTAVHAQAQKLRATLQRNRRRGKWESSAYHIDSQRQVTQLKPFNWSWSFTDPSAEEVGWDFAFHGLANRYQDTIHSIRRMLGHHRTAIARRALELQRAGARQMDLDFPDPFEPFQRAFALLLAPKQLAAMELDWDEPRYTLNGQVLDLHTLSSGEREVFTIVMDLVLHQPEDCVIFFDEPELHLHPELSFRLLKTLQTIGARNQFVLCTHSADVISGSLEHSVVFIRPPRGGENQGIAVKPGDESVRALKELGQSLGVISLGRKIVLIEGNERSIDRDTYGAITQATFPELVLAPSGSRQTSLSFAKVVEEVLDRTLWGIEFFMLADRDTSLPEARLADLEANAQGRLRFLPRLHIENYFLDGATIALAFQDLVGADSWLRNAAAIEDRLRAIARESIPVAVNMWLSTQLRSLVGEIDIALKDVDRKTQAELIAMLPARITEEQRRVSRYLEPAFAEAELRARWAMLENSLAEGSQEWRRLFPGKLLVGRFCGVARIQKGYFTSLYIAQARRQESNPFQEIIDIFSRWVSISPGKRV